MPETEIITIQLTDINIQKFYRVASASPFHNPTNLVNAAVRTLLEEHAPTPPHENHPGMFVTGLGFNPTRFC